MSMQIEYHAPGDAMTDWAVWGNGYWHRSDADVVMHRLLENGLDVRLYGSNGLKIAEIHAADFVPLAEVQKQRHAAFRSLNA